MNHILNKFGIDKPTNGMGSRVFLRLQKLRRFLWMLRSDYQTKVSLSMQDTLRAWRYGFMRWSYFLYGLDKNDPRMFISDRVQFLEMDFINGAHQPACAQKVIFSRYVGSLGAPCPRIHAVIVRGHVYIIEGMELAEADLLFKLIEEYPPGIVLKPIVGCEGLGVAFLKRNKEGCELNGRTATDDEVKAVVSQLDNYLVTDFVIQHEYAQSLYPRTTNTLRLLTFWDYDTNQPFLAAAVQRIGTSRSYPVDNFKMGAGGISALVDSDTGRLGYGICRPDEGPMQRYACHPETGNPIEGGYVPRWKETVEDILRFSARMPYLPIIGWDLVMTPEGYQVIETNPGSGLFVIQVHKPLLSDKRVQKFLKFHKCNRGCS